MLFSLFPAFNIASIGDIGDRGGVLVLQYTKMSEGHYITLKALEPLKICESMIYSHI